MDIVKKEMSFSKSITILLWIVGIVYAIDRIIEILSFFKIL